MTTPYTATPDLPTLRAGLVTTAESLGRLRGILRDRLIPTADPAVASRSKDVGISLFRVETVNGEVGSFHGTTLNGWNPRITFLPSTGHHCTCPDWANRKRVCKHVVALAENAIGHLVTKENAAYQAVRLMDEKVAALQTEFHQTLRLVRV